MNFKTKLNKVFKRNNSLLCLGLDSDLEKIPEKIKSRRNPQFVFNKAVIDATDDLVCAYKLNSAFYEAEGPDGIRQLKLTIDYIKEQYPEIPVILDAKRGDIGNSNKAYVKFAFDFLGADALTVHPYLGKESLKPFLEESEKGVFVLCRTSNCGAGEFQDLQIGDKLLYQTVAEKVVNEWNYNDNCGLVVGATYPEELKIVRHIVGNMIILIPGIGTQGGNIERTIRSGIDASGQNTIINSSRSIIFASSAEDFAQKAREKALEFKDKINKYR